MKKKISLFALVAVLVLSLVGCSSQTLKIEGHDWELTLIQSTEDGSIIGCASEHYEMHKDIENMIVVDLVCTAKDGSLTITDKTNNQSYEGTYTLADSTLESTMYNIVLGEENGTAVSSYTEYEEGAANTKKTPTLIISIGNYALNFQSE